MLIEHALSGTFSLTILQLEDPDSFENWEKLVRTAEALEGGLNRNSSPQSISATRDIYDRFLAKFPLLFGYWKKYADLEFSIAGTEAAELVGYSLWRITRRSADTARYTNAVSPASLTPLTYGPITAPLKSRPAMTPTSFESK